MKANFFRSLLNKAVLTGSLLASSFYAAQNASAQESFEDFYKKKAGQKQEDKKPSISDDEKTVSKKLDEILNGSLQIKAETEPLVDRASATFQAEMKLGDFRPYFGIQDEYQRFKNIDDSEMKVNSVREILGLGFYAHNTEDLEVYMRGILGREDIKFSENIKMDASRWIFGGEFGLKIEDFRGLLKVYGGKGEFGAKLDSDLEIDGDYGTLFAGLDVVQRLYTGNEKFAEFEKAGVDRWRNDVPTGLVELVAQAYWNRNKFGELETDDTYSLKIGPRFSWDLRDESGKGGILSITSYVMGKLTDTESGISLRETRTKTLGVGIQPAWDITPNLRIGGDFALQYNGQKIDDPGQGLHEDKTKNGVKAGLYIELKF